MIIVVSMTFFCN